VNPNQPEDPEDPKSKKEAVVREAYKKKIA